MPKKILSKIKDNSGASIGLALMYVVIVATFCIILLTSGSVIASKTKSRADSEKSYYLSASALSIFNEELSDGVITYNTSDNLAQGEKLSLLYREINDAFSYVYKNRSSYSNSFELEVGDSFVLGSILVDEDYNINITISKTAIKEKFSDNLRYDLNKDGELDSEDVSYLESYVSNPSSKTISVNCDFNFDNKVDSNDVEYFRDNISNGSYYLELGIAKITNIKYEGTYKQIDKNNFKVSYAEGAVE